MFLTNGSFYCLCSVEANIFQELQCALDVKRVLPYFRDERSKRKANCLRIKLISGKVKMTHFLLQKKIQWMFGSMEKFLKLP